MPCRKTRTHAPRMAWRPFSSAEDFFCEGTHRGRKNPRPSRRYYRQWRTETLSGDSRFWQPRGACANSSPHHQHFPNLVTAQKELDRGKVAEQVLDMPVIKYSLQSKARRDGAVDGSGGAAAHFALGNDGLHVENVGPHDVVAVAGSVGARIAGVEEGQQHSARLQQGP